MTRSIIQVQYPSRAEIKALRIIQRQRTVYGAELGEILGMGNKRVAPIIRSLKEKELIEIAGDSTGEPGKHRVYLRITRDGRKALEMIDSGEPYSVVRAFFKNRSKKK